MRTGPDNGRTGTTTILAGFLVSAVLGLTACGADGENTPTRASARASEPSIDRPSGGVETTRSRTARTESAETARPPTSTGVTPARTTTPEENTRPTTSTAVLGPEPTRTTAAPETTTRPATSAAVAAPGPTRTTAPAGTTPTPAPSASAAAAAAPSQAIGPFGRFLLIALVAAMLIGGLLVYRSQRRSAWDTEARALESETRGVTTTRLPPVLSTTVTGQRGVAWPPVRAALIDLMSRWNALTERASGEGRRAWSVQISGLLQELIAAVDAETGALAAGQDPLLLRPRVSQAEQALAAALAVRPQPESPAADEPGSPVIPQ